MKRLFSKLFSIAVFSILFCNLYGQSLELKNVTKEGFKGLIPLDDKGYYIQYIEGKTGKGKEAKTIFHLYMVDNDLKVTSDFVIGLTQAEKIEDVAYNGANFMIIFSNQKAKTRTFKIMDKAGQEVTSKTISDVPSQLMSKPSAIYPISGGDFMVISYVKAKKVGYNVERYNDKLEMKYSTQEIPEKKKLFPVDFVLSGETFYVLEYVDADMSDYFEYHVAAFNINTGAMTGKKQLKSADEKSYGYATFLRPTSDGGIITGGMYYNGSRIQEANSDGFFAAKMGADANLTYSYVDWKTINSAVRESNTATMWGGKTKTFMHDLNINSDGSFTLIGENFRVGDADLAGEKGKNGIGAATKALSMASGSNEPKEWALTAADFILLDFDASNNFKGVRKIDKPNAVTVVKGSSDPNDLTYNGQFRGLNLANILNNKGYMPYRFVVKSNSVDYLLYWQRYDPIQTELLYFTPLNAATMDTVSVNVTGAEIIYYNKKMQESLSKMGGFGKLVQKVNEADKKIAGATGSYKENYVEIRGSDDPNDYRAKSAGSRVVKGNVENKVLMYDFIPDENAETKPTSYRIVESLPGTLKLWYLDIPKK